MTDTTNAAILVEGLTKSFGEVPALRGVDFAVPRGAVFGLLGPNGAGKTTAVRILTTLLRPDAGRALVEGHDVVRQPAAVRRVIGLAGQSAAIHEELTGRENLEIVCRLYHFGRAESKVRAQELLARFDLTEAGDRLAKTYSGGMQRRLDLAASLAGRPAVLFLDEPTTGLDPAARMGMWAVVRELVSAGTTLLLTTQYLEEADALADEIMVIDRGLVIAAGAPEQLKDQVGGDVLEFTVADRDLVGRAVGAVAGLTELEVKCDAESGRIGVPVGARGSRAIMDVARLLDAAGVEINRLTVRRPSLDDVFVALTGRSTSEEQAEAGVASLVGPAKEGS